MTIAAFKMRFLLSFAPLLVLPVLELFAQDGGAAFMQAGEMTATPSRAAQGAQIYTASPLQARVDSLRTGDTLHVATGAYVGNLRLTKRVVLIGENWPVLSADLRGSVVEIVADSCEIRGFIIENSGRRLVDEDAGVLVRSRNNRLVGNRLRDILFGIYLFEANDNLLADNVIEGLHELDLGGRGSGVHLWNSRGNRLHNNRITHTRDGIYMQYAPSTQITNNAISEVRYGLHYMYSDSNLFVDNTFSRSLAGAAIMYSDHILFKRNRFIQNHDFTAFGLLFQDCSFCVADSNILADNSVALFLEAGVSNVFRNNRIIGNDVALEIFSSSDKNVFTHNSFEDNRSPLFLVGKRTGAVWEKDGVGNYWSSYEGYDLDADGIGDVPYRIQNIFDYLEGRHPSLRLFLESPASQALATATKTFPIFDISRERDDHPLMQPLEFSLNAPSASEKNSRAVPATLTSLSLVLVGFVMLSRWNRRKYFAELRKKFQRTQERPTDLK
jgi:nitrous oxidase accessory protein